MNIPTAQARLVTDNRNGKKYVYAAWSQREKIDKKKSGKKKGSGKSKVLSHKVYLGTEQEVLKKITSPKNSPQKVYSKEFGLPMSILTIAKELGLVEIIDELLPYKVNGIKASEFILISAISKLNGSISKDKTGNYFEKTVLPGVMNIKSKNLHSKSYWSMFEKIISEKELKDKKHKMGKKFNDKLTLEELEELIDDKKLETIEEKLWSNLLKKYNVLLDILLYDGTNSFTYYQDHTRNSYGQKGKNKKMRHNLRQIGLFIAVTGNGFPFISQLACGNLHDATLFPTAMGKLIKRYHKVIDEAKKIKLSFDKGNNSKKNIKAISQTEYIGNLSPSNFEGLCSITLDQYNLKYKDNPVYEETIELFGSKHKIFITYNEALKRKQEKSFIKQKQRVIEALKEKYRKYKKVNVKEVMEELNTILKNNKILGKDASTYLTLKISTDELEIKDKNKKIKNEKEYQKEKERVKKILLKKIKEHKKENAEKLNEELNNMLNANKILHSKACRYLDYKIRDGKLIIGEDADKIAKRAKVFGKNIIFTNKLEGNHVEIIAASKDRYKVESAFDDIKDHRLISFHPIWHWTDSKIRIDAFISVLAFLLIKLLQHQAEKAGLKMSIPSLTEALTGIREVMMVYSDKTVERRIDEVPQLQEKLLKTFGVIS
jgi:transposase